jgi:hypothetical protein
LRDDKKWSAGQWMSLPDMLVKRVGPALCVIHGVLYASGGVDESTHEFTDTCERYDPGPSDAFSALGLSDGMSPGEHIVGTHSKWVMCEGMGMPTALHAHTSHGLPVL